ncbi:MAG TPA: hypothetical protein VN898_14960 [Candidatus Binatia bacterium]|nr:hypothetical protein [Candidatus Binatia bacterium]
MSWPHLLRAPRFGALLLGTLLTAGGPPALASTESAAAEFRLLASGGSLFFWDGASTELSPASGIASAPQGFRSVLPLGEGRVLLVEPAEVPPGKEREKRLREGEAVVLGLRGTAAERGPVVGFEGAPRAAAVSPDGRRAWVLAWRGSPGTQGSRGWLHAIDVERAEVVDSSLLSSVASGIATDASGRRLYVALQDRIQTYGADPVRVSWQYRSPGANGPIAIAPGRDVVAVGRGAQLALFDAERIAALGAQERHSRRDDATTVATLPFNVTRLAWAQDGSLLAALGDRGLVFLDPGNGALLWPTAPAIDFSGSTDAQVLAFPGPDHDVVVALTPHGTVSALRAPTPSLPKPEPSALPAGKAGDPPPEAEAVKKSEPVQKAQPVQNVAPLGEAEPTPAPPPEPANDAAPAPSREQEAGPPLLRGRVAGGAKTIVLYGPNNILKEATRVPIQADGTWSLALPEPGTYRVVAIGDGSTPIPVVPTFRTITVRAGIAESGIDFEVRTAP